MENKVDNWSFQMPTEEGLYLVCFGDVESPQNISLEHFMLESGVLMDKDRVRVQDYHESYKFAKLSFN